MSLSATLRQAASLQEKIETLRGQLAALLDRARAELDAPSGGEPSATLRRGRPKPLRATVVKKGARGPRARPAAGTGRSPLAGRKRAASPSGPLAPAVAGVLAAAGQPLAVGEILERLLAGGYQFNAPQPRKNLAARIYRLAGVRKVGAGKFALAAVPSG